MRQRIESGVYFCSLLTICLLWALFAGKDLNWDALNYHLYLGLNFFQDRFSQDYFPASVQSYFNPLPFVPFYLMVSLKWKSVVISSALAVLHSVNLWIVYKVSRLIVGAQGRLFVLLSVAIGALTSVFWVEVGSSFSDVLVSIPILAAIYLVILGVAEGEAGRPFLVAGLALGVAVGMKLTAAIDAVAAVVAFVVLFFRLDRQSGKKLLLILLAGAVGVSVIGGYWWWKVWSRFGNPFFPYFNQYFHSPYFSLDAFYNARFLPINLFEYVARPFRMALPDTWVYTETISPDFRFALLIIITIALNAFPVVRSRFFGLLKVNAGIRYLLTFLIVDYFLWLSTSGNGRYAIPFLLLLGPAIVGVFSCFAISVRRVGLATLLVAQSVALVVACQSRWTAAPWGEHWYDVELSAELEMHPYLYLSLGMNSLSFLASHVDSRSSFVSVNGQYPLSLDGAGGARVKTLLDKWSGRVRMLLQIPNTYAVLPLPAAFFNGVDSHVSRFGLSVVEQSCLPIRVQLGEQAPSLIMSCLLKSNDEALAHFEMEKHKVAPVFVSLERACKSKFKPVGGALIVDGVVWRKHYVGTEYTVSAYNDRVMMKLAHELNPTDLGLLDEWQGGVVTEQAKLVCGNE